MSQELVDGRFRIGQVIGRGNMGEVHRAEDLHAPEGSPERTVAVNLRSRTGAHIDTGGDAKAVQRLNPLVDGENYTSTLIPPPGHGPRHPA
ncbi:hypothetical protein ACH4VX_06785 [Streptomyces sp. NPDC020731]|uniref:hypothetical protein n=1 Tax=Streptomyces sp. NPDC020731 TaxID=3365085 RepID=UPI00379190AC